MWCERVAMSSTAQISAPQAPASVEPVRVLLVDDQPHVRQAAAAIVEHTAGFELVGQSGDGESALRLADRLKPDMVLLDVRMPGMDGFDTARRLDSPGSRRVVVLVTGADVRELASLARSSRVAALVHKHWLNSRLLRGLWIVHRPPRRRQHYRAAPA
jgi:DNA-binding NarL/FixJ family response regulator